MVGVLIGGRCIDRGMMGSGYGEVGVYVDDTGWLGVYWGRSDSGVGGMVCGGFMVNRERNREYTLYHLYTLAVAMIVWWNVIRILVGICVVCVWSRDDCMVVLGILSLSRSLSLPLSYITTYNVLPRITIQL